MTFVELLLSVIASTVIIGGALIGILRWGHKQIVTSVKEELTLVNKEVVPNGGSSLRDAIDRIEEETVRQGRELDEVVKSFERHLGWHEGQQHAK